MKVFTTHMSNRRKKTENSNRLYRETKTSEITIRKPFQDKGNFNNIPCEFLQDKEHEPATFTSNKPRKRSYLNSNNNAISSKMTALPSNPDNTINIFPSVVEIERISIDGLREQPSFDPSVLLEHLSEEDLSKHLKQCNVIVTNILQESNRNKQAKRSNEGENVNMVGDNISEDKNKYVALRKRKYKIDYAQFNRGSPLAKQPVEHHVPVYKKQVKEKVKVPNDVYDFDSDSENKKTKKKKRKKTLDASVPFEKHMKVEMQKIESRAKKKLKRIQQRVVKNKEKPLNNVKVKITDRNIKKEKQEAKLQRKNTETIIPTCDETDIEGNDLDLSDVDSAPVELEICTEEKSTSVNIVNKNCVPDSRINILQNICLNTDGSENAEVSFKESKENCSTEFDELFDFDTLKSPIGKSTPWRPDLQVRRNPFFLQYKETLLPSYNQDMVIDSTATEKASLGNKTPKNLFPNPSKTRQTSILSFVNGKNLCDSPDVIDSSLFDIHELSPVKSASKSHKKLSKSNSANKENQCSTNAPSKQDIRKIKRRILSDKVDNTLNILNSPAKSSNAGNNSFRDENEVTYFGFESLNDISNTNEPQLEKRTRDMTLIGKPFRVEKYLKLGNVCKDKFVNDNCKKQEENLQIHEAKETQEEDIPIGITQETEDDLSLAVGIFDDLEPVNKNNVPRKYDRKHKKRVRKHSVASNDDKEDEYPQPKKKKKDKRTKEEEEQAEKWAKEFNKMCDEVDNFALEIE